MKIKILISIIAPLIFCLILISDLSVTAQQTIDPLPTTIESPTGMGTVTVVLTPTKDNTLYENPAIDTSNGAGSHFYVGKTDIDGAANGTLRRGVLAFGISGTIPSLSTIISASLKVNVTREISGDEIFALHRLSGDWGEGTSVAPGEGGAGTLAEPGDATWNHSFYSATTWITPGGDFIVTPTMTTTIGGLGTHIWSTTPELITDIQAWVDAPTMNYGWIVRGNEIDSASAKRFATKEHSNATLHPMLTIEYLPPKQIFLPIIVKN